MKLNLTKLQPRKTVKKFTGNLKAFTVSPSVREKIKIWQHGRSWEENADEINAEILESIKQRKILLDSGIDPHDNPKYQRSPYF